MLPDLEAWAIFAKVAEMGSFAGAANELGLSKSTISKAITRLEHRLGAPLLTRTSRRLSLTQNGLANLERAARILAEGEAVEAEAAQQLSAPRGLVRIAAPMSFGLKHLAPILPQFMASYPEVSVDMVLDDQLADLVGQGFDLAIRITSMTDSSLRARRLCSISRPLTASPKYLEEFGTPNHPSDLRDHQCLIYTNIASPNLWRFHHAELGEVQTNVSGRLRSNNGDTLLEALLQGQGIALLPSFAVFEHIKRGDLVHILPEWSGPEIGLHLVLPPHKLKPARVSVLIDFLGKHFHAPAWGN